MMKHIIAFLVCITIPFALIGQVEICDNGIDDDNDTLIDINDEDCTCEIIEIKSLIPNPSFEEMNCCPNDRSQLDCATSWIQASEPTTDFIHLCDWLGWGHFPPPQPFPDGQGIMGFRDGRVTSTQNPEPYWKEYAGACLIHPLLADTLYRFQFDVGFVDAEKSPPIDITFFGTSSCDNLPFGLGDNAFGCPTNSPNWIKLGEVRISGGSGNKWVNTFIEVVPDQDIYAIAIGPDCQPVSTPESIYYFFDNLFLTNFNYFDLQISEVSHPCNQDYILAVPYNPEFEYQWYLSGVALEGEVFSKLTQNYGEGSYQVRILEDASCRISQTFEYKIPTYNTTAAISICEGEVFQFGEQVLTGQGFYLDTLQTENNCDSIVALELKVVGEKYDTIEVSILNGETYEISTYSFDKEGDYPLIFNSSIGCDSLVLLKILNFDIFIPNVFSPNADGINDQFSPVDVDDRIISFEMKIYDRWGNQVYRGKEWNGSGFQTDVYVYLIEMVFEYGKSKTYYGSVTLLK